jgi:hypothetical protein
MMMLFYAHLLCVLVFVVACSHPLQLLFWPLPGKDLFPFGGYSAGSHQRRLHQLAYRQLRWAVVWYCVVMGFVHLYSDAHEQLVARREAARMQPAPYRCLDNFDWSALTAAQKTSEYMLGDDAAEQRCAAYLARTRAGVWPSPLGVLVDTLLVMPVRCINAVADAFGAGVSSFLSHFSALLQLYMVFVLPAGALVLLWLWPWIRVCLWARPSVQYNEPQRASTVCIEAFDNDNGIKLIQ